jgi:hypothetical protein
VQESVSLRSRYEERKHLAQPVVGSSQNKSARRNKNRSFAQQSFAIAQVHRH